MAGGRCLIRPHFEPSDPRRVRHNATMLKRDLLAVTGDNIVDGLKGCLIGNGLILGPQGRCRCGGSHLRSEEHTSELQSLMRISYAVFCLKQKKNKQTQTTNSR